MSRQLDYNAARDELAAAHLSLDALQDAVSKGNATSVSPVEVVRLRIELGVAYARLAAIR